MHLCFFSVMGVLLEFWWWWCRQNCHCVM